MSIEYANESHLKMDFKSMVFVFKYMPGEKVFPTGSEVQYIPHPQHALFECLPYTYTINITEV